MGAAGRQRSSVCTTQQLLVAVLFVALLASAVRQPADSYTWWHLKNGQLMTASLLWTAVVALLMLRYRRCRLLKMVLADRPEEIAPREDMTALCVRTVGAR